MFTIKMSLSLNMVKLSLKGSNFLMINHRTCEQLIPIYNNLKIMSLERAKTNYCKMCTQFLTWLRISPFFLERGYYFSNVKKMATRYQR